MFTGNLQPIIVALAAFIVAITPGIATLITVLANREALARIERTTNGTAAQLHAEVKALRTAAGDTVAPTTPEEPK